MTQVQLSKPLKPPPGAVSPDDKLVDELLDKVVSTFLLHYPSGDVSLIVGATRLAAKAHSGQFRRSGDPYITHPAEVAFIVADLGLDAVSVASAMLHDVLEDTNLAKSELLKQLPANAAPAIVAIVEGVTKLDALHFDSQELRQAATMRKMLVAMAKDWRVLIIKLADRLHNMQTLSAMPVETQRRIARETMDIYAPLAHRLGMSQVKWQLEDLAFATLQPKRYEEIAKMISTRVSTEVVTGATTADSSPLCDHLTPPTHQLERQEQLTQIIDQVKQRLDLAGISAEVTGRPKHLWSIYEKMVLAAKEFDEIYDLLGIRVIVESEKGCWEVLGIIHGMWQPVQGRFKDYISSPKFNLYQSLHTTVMVGSKPLEVQIRTQQMHKIAEYGIAAHWGYKESGQTPLPQEVAWVSRMLQWQNDTEGPLEFLETLKSDLQTDEIYVFTPKGKVITLPTGATPIDFAYAVHTEIGHHCIGAKLNGRLVPLQTPLSSADTLEIITTKSVVAGPSADWIHFVATPKARSKIRQWFNVRHKKDVKDLGREELIRELHRQGIPLSKQTATEELTKLAELLKYETLDGMYVDVADGHITPRVIVDRLAKLLREGKSNSEEQLPAVVQPFGRAGMARGTFGGTAKRQSRKTSDIGIWVEGLDDVMVRLARCCAPVAGDEIVGFVTKGRGISVHRSDCANGIWLGAKSNQQLIEVEWNREAKGVFPVQIEVVAFDRSHLLADVTTSLSDHHLNIISSHTSTNTNRITKMRFEFELADLDHLGALISSLQHIDSVFDVYRIMPRSLPKVVTPKAIT